MKEINFKFNDGTKSTVNVDDEFYKEYEKLEVESKRIERKETRRHISIYEFEEQGIEFEDENCSIESNLLDKERKEVVHSAIKKLAPKQQELVYQVFYLNKSLSEIAKEKGVSKSAITQQMQVICKRLKEILKNFEI